MEKRARRSHGIRSRKVSVSVSEEDLRLLSARAKRVYRGNLSAVVHELADGLRRREALARLLGTFEGAASTVSEIQALRDEIASAPTGRRKRRPAA